MERIQGVKISDRQALADLFIRSMCQQMLIDGFFHSDPRPGNVFYEPDRNTLVFLDLGMIGHLTRGQRDALMAMIFAISRRDVQDIADIATTLGTLTRPVDRSALSQEADRILDRYLSVSMGNLVVTDLLGAIMNMLLNHGIRPPQNLSMAIKTLIQAEEVAYTLDPKIKTLEIVQSTMRQVARERLRPAVLARELSGQVRMLSSLTRETPETLRALFVLIQKGKLPVQLESPSLDAGVEHININADRLVPAVILAGVSIASAIAMPPLRDLGSNPGSRRHWLCGRLDHRHRSRLGYRTRHTRDQQEEAPP